MPEDTRQTRVIRKFLWLPRKFGNVFRWFVYANIVEEKKKFVRSKVHVQYYSIYNSNRPGWYDPRGLAGQVFHVYGKKRVRYAWIESNFA